MLYKTEYSKLTFGQIQYLTGWWYQYFPQRPTISEPTSRMLRNTINALHVQRPKIVELGCHDGSWAEDFLVRNPFNVEWNGYDINPRAIEDGLSRMIVGNSSIFDINLYLLSTQIYEVSKPLMDADIFFSSHTLEHMDWRQVEHLIVALYKKNVKHVIYEIPTLVSRGFYPGSNAHVLKVRERELEDYFASFKYELIEMCKHERGSSWRLTRV